MAQLRMMAGDSGSRKSGNGLQKTGATRIVPAAGAARERLQSNTLAIRASTQPLLTATGGVGVLRGVGEKDGLGHGLALGAVSDVAPAATRAALMKA